jgi:8-oxo-dGTP diphosphatase
MSDGELDAYRFHEPVEASGLLRPYVWHRVRMALDVISGAATFYLHDGQWV